MNIIVWPVAGIELNACCGGKLDVLQRIPSTTPYLLFSKVCGSGGKRPEVLIVPAEILLQCLASSSTEDPDTAWVAGCLYGMARHAGYCLCVVQ